MTISIHPINPGKKFTALVLLIFVMQSQLFSQEKVEWKKVNVLIYTRNGKGYVHDNIPSAVACVQKLASRYGFRAQTTDDPAAFTNENLKQYALLIFTSTNNDVFDTDEQRLAFRHYIESGGGFVGIHSVIGTERNWRWFKTMLGGSFAWHPKFQRYKIVAVDHAHPSLSGLPRMWEKEDECYFMKEMYPGIHTLMAHDLTSLSEIDKDKLTASAGPFAELYPAVWHQQFDGGYIWITALGHDKKDYEDKIFVQHIFNGIQFIASQVKKRNPEKAYALSKDDAVR